MIKLSNIRPMSINNAYSFVSGKRVKSFEYRTYESKVLTAITKQNIKIHLPKTASLFLIIRFGISPQADIDNCIKPFIDVLQKAFNFNDNKIETLVTYKIEVEQGDEFIEFQLGINKIIWDEEKLESLPTPATAEQVRDCIK